MGLDLNKLVPSRALEHDDLAGKRVAIDLPNLLYAAYMVRILTNPSDRAGAVHFAQQLVIQRVLDLAELGARSILIPDGPAHPLKRETLLAREAQRAKNGTPRLEEGDYAHVFTMAAALGVPVIRAVHDAEAQAGWLVQEGQADVVATTDHDALLYGATVVLRGLSGKSPARGGNWTIVQADDAWSALGIRDREELALVALLMGCDMSPGLPGIGPKKAIKHVQDAAGDLARLTVDLAPLGDAHARLAEIYAPPVNDDARPTWSAPKLEEALPALVQAGFRDTPELRSSLARLSILHDARSPDEADRAVYQAAAREGTEAQARARLAAADRAQTNLGAFLA